MREQYDAIVVGLGGMGSATAYHLASRGQRVLGLERFGIPHSMGSSHGITRIIRLAYYEHPAYVPLLQRAFDLWRSLQTDFGEQLLFVTGSIDAGPPGGAVFEGSLESCRLHGLSHEVLNSAQVSDRFPAYRLPSDTAALFQPDGGFLLPERCVVAHANAARALGADLHTGEPVRGWEARGDGVRVWTDTATYTAERLVLTVGAWARELVGPLLQGLAEPERQVLIWLGIRRPELFTPARFPVFNVLVPEGRFYGFPEWSVPGFKFGKYHHLAEQVDPDSIDRVANAADEAALRIFAERYFPDAAGATLDMQVCMFTNTPDEHFIVDVHPEYPQVSIAAGFSGHGFKFCSVIGEIMADLALDGATCHNIDLFRLRRFAATPC
ncbi:MAG TPA: N-methyl-L-tryptophan oxidase [Chloroflexota bacterium]|nr:N-methyl-L-tryptophan oxidase [Chloroflexota bacterium]